MNEWMVGAMMALWLGVLTSISPCPLATNIAAVSYISRRGGSARAALLSGLMYAGGRTLTYVVLGFILAASVLAVPEVSGFLQKYMNMIMGPLLVLVGMFLLGMLKLPSGSGSSWAQRFQGRAERMGIWGSALLGLVFALSFCPTSAALFFGSLMPLTMSNNAVLGYPLLYGVGTALPVILFALVIAFSAKGLGAAFRCVTRFEAWARTITGVVFIGIGVWMTFRFILLAP